MIEKFKRSYERFKHRQKLSVAIPINHKAYQELLKFWSKEDMDLGDTILRIIEQNKLKMKDAKG